MVDVLNVERQMKMLHDTLSQGQENDEAVNGEELVKTVDIKGQICGIFHINMDVRGRIILPAKLRATLPPSLLLTIGPSLPCLKIYTETSWRDYVEGMVLRLGSARAFVDWKRNISPWICDVDIGSDGRILIPSSLTEYGQLSKRCILLGVGGHLELWDEDKYYAFRETGGRCGSRSEVE